MAIEVIKRKKSKIYRVRLMRDGRKVSRNFERHFDAVQFEKEAKSDNGLPVNIDMTFEEAAKQWLEKHSLIYKTFSGYKIDLLSLNKNIFPMLGRFKLNKIGPQHIENLILELKKRNLANSTVNRNLTVVGAIFNHYLKKRFISFNPLVAVGKLKIDEQGYQYWSLKEASQFLEYTEKKYSGTNRYSVYLLYKVALHTGMRFGELLALKWSAIDFENRIITVCRAYCRYERGIKETTKSRKIRHVPLGKAIYEDLQEAFNNQTCELVFHWANSIIDDANLRHRHFEKDVEEAKVKRIRFHDMRHTYASHFMMNGGNPYALQAILGHSSLKMTDRYAHLSKAYLADKSDIVQYGNGKVIHADFQKNQTGAK